jgi:hypothetical protein
MGHATINYEEGEPDDHGVRFGEELRASPPRRYREFVLQKATSSVARPLFHGEGSKRMSPARSFQAESTLDHQESEVALKMMTIYSGHGQCVGLSKQVQDITTNDLAKSVKGLHLECRSASVGYGTNNRGGRERVSFGMNMTMNDEESDSGNVEQDENRLDNAVARFHARKFGTMEGRGSEKRIALKVQGAGSAKK